MDEQSQTSPLYGRLTLDEFSDVQNISGLTKALARISTLSQDKATQWTALALLRL